MSELVEIGEIQKNPTTKIKFSITNYKGRDYFDIREYVDSSGGYSGPTKKGIRIDAENYDEFMEIMEKIGEEIKKNA